jgi:hypothetical protein
VAGIHTYEEEEEEEERCCFADTPSFRCVMSWPSEAHKPKFVVEKEIILDVTFRH